LERKDFSFSSLPRATSSISYPSPVSTPRRMETPPPFPVCCDPAPALPSYIFTPASSGPFCSVGSSSPPTTFLPLGSPPGTPSRFEPLLAPFSETASPGDFSPCSEEQPIPEAEQPASQRRSSASVCRRRTANPPASPSASLFQKVMEKAEAIASVIQTRSDFLPHARDDELMHFLAREFGQNWP
jgi:hypothetical protein